MNTLFSLKVWRESVCMGDDCDAPHELVLSVPLDISLREVTDRFLDGRYLAQIAGGKAAWILDGNRPLSVFAQQWTQPRFLVSPDTLLTDFINPEGKPHLHFRYWCQVNPERVFDCLMRGLALPDRYGR